MYLRYGRPWKGMFQIYDTADSPELGETIQTIRNQLEDSPKMRKLFGVHPAELSSLDKESTCTICLEDWQDQELAMM